jgi:uncharacterized protein (DUF2267 family)
MTATTPTWRCARRCTRCANRLGPEKAVHFSAQLPMLGRGLYFEGWHLAGRPTKERTRARFLSTIDGASCPRARGIDPDLAARAVFGVIWEKLEVGEIGKMIARLPADLQELRR